MDFQGLYDIVTGLLAVLFIFWGLFVLIREALTSVYALLLFRWSKVEFLSTFSILENLWSFLCTLVTLYIALLALRYSVLLHHYLKLKEPHNNPRKGPLSDGEMAIVLMIYAISSAALLQIWCSQLGWIKGGSWLLAMFNGVLFQQALSSVGEWVKAKIEGRFRGR